MTWVLTGICLVCAIWSTLCATAAMGYARQARAAKKATELMLGAVLLERLVESKPEHVEDPSRN